MLSVAVLVLPLTILTTVRMAATTPEPYFSSDINGRGFPAVPTPNEVKRLFSGDGLNDAGLERLLLSLGSPEHNRELMSNYNRRRHYITKRRMSPPSTKGVESAEPLLDVVWVLSGKDSKA